MAHKKNQKRLISHKIAPKDLKHTVNTIADKIKNAGDKPHITVSRQLELLDELSQFDLGRFLIQNRGADAFWTHYFLTHPWFGRKTGKNNRDEPFTELEEFILDRSPLLLATQERFQIFLKENQKSVHNNATLATIPSGMMGELLYLDFKGINNIKLIGIDYDPNALKEAEILAKKLGLSQFVTLIERDAWNLNIHNEFDLISSNGLNIYEPDDNEVTELYREFYNALKPKGKLVTSFLTPPPTQTDNCEWVMSEIDQKDLALQKIIFVDIINTKFQCYRSTKTTHEQLEKVGFKEIEFKYDKAKIFPTVIAIK